MEISIFIEKITPTYCLQIRVPTVLMLVRNKLMHILQRGGEQQNTSFIFFLPEGGMKINIPLQGEGYRETSFDPSPTRVQPESNPSPSHQVLPNFDTCFFYHGPMYGLTFYHNVGETTDYLSVGCSINRINLKID